VLQELTASAKVTPPLIGVGSCRGKEKRNRGRARDGTDDAGGLSPNHVSWMDGELLRSVQMEKEKKGMAAA